MKRAASQRLIESFNPKGLPTLGHLVWWDCEGVEMAASKFKDLFEECALPTGLCMAVRSRTALVKALKELERGKLIRKIIDDESQIVYVIVREDIDLEAQDVDFQKENRVIYDKFDGTLEFRTEGSLPDQIREHFNRYEGQYTSREVRKVVTNTVKHFGGITVRRAGGMYFMTNVTAVGKLQMLFEHLQGEIHQFTALGILDSPAYRATLLTQVRQELLGDLKRAEQANDKILQMAERGRARPKSLETRLSKMKELSTKAHLFKDIGYDTTPFDHMLSKTVRKVEKTLTLMELSDVDSNN